jgi:hypothetical protein
MVFPARQMIFDVIGDLLADRRQRKQGSHLGQGNC